MKTILFFFLALSTASAQTGYVCEYKFQYKIDTVNNKFVKIENFYLIGNNGQSAFLPVNRYLQDSLTQENNTYKTKIINGMTVIDIGSMPLYYSSIYVLKNQLKREMLSFKQIGVNKYYSSENIKIKWVLSGDTIYSKKHNRTLNIATTSYGGRNYTAWFAPDIPISDGPYKFSGLPGLIFAVKDDDGYYSFSLEKILTNQNKVVPPSLESASAKMSVQELAKIDQSVDNSESYGVEVFSADGTSIDRLKNQKVGIDKFIERY